MLSDSQLVPLCLNILKCLRNDNDEHVHENDKEQECGGKEHKPSTDLVRALRVSVHGSKLAQRDQVGP